MLLTQKTTVKLDPDDANFIGHMCYAAFKLWNVCNYERLHYKELNLSVYPNWYYQKKAHKQDLWYKQLPSQTAQEVCKQLNSCWKSFYTKQTKGDTNARPPRFKNENMAITYMQNALVHEKDSPIIRLSLPKQLKAFMLKEYGICKTYLYLENPIFKSTNTVKQIKLYPPVNGKCVLLIIYEIEDVEPLSDNGDYLSIDLGLHNLMTCYHLKTGETFIVGRKYLSLCNYYQKEIARVQSQWYKQQDRKKVKYLKSSKHIRKLYKDKNNAIHDYLHKVTRLIANYCKENQIHTVVIGDLKNIRKNKNLGKVTNQKLHALPYDKIYILLEYKLACYGITLVKQSERYSSQTSPLKEKVSKENAAKSNRVKRGLYQDGIYTWNADCVGAFNILRLYFDAQKIDITPDAMSIKSPYVLKVAV